MTKKQTKAQKKRTRRLLVQAVEYMIAGGAYFWTGYLVFFIADKGLGLSLFWSKMIANIVGWTVNFLLQRYWVFRNPDLKDKLAQTSGRYIFITLVNFFLDYLIVAGLKSVGITPYIGQFISSGFFTVWNYFWYRFWVFPEQHHPAKTAPRVRTVHRHLSTRH
jgi:putative flippase GtrA